MKVVVSAQAPDLDAFVDPRFGRCRYFLFIDTDNMRVESVPNGAREAAGGAGIQAAQLVVEKGAQAVITGTVGPNADAVLKQANVPVYRSAGTVSMVIEKFKVGKLPQNGARD
ncbi:MAG: NifB/NifX family molybdenum-iron cluster-binding protein [bacterium]|jgi:predicted Fe-Mo cluster-binding NifX family protein